MSTKSCNFAASISKYRFIMAKQKGLFPLEGKLGDHSFYETAGVPGTCVRRINAGLSQRVKNNAEYENTRLNNDEFRRANSIVKALYDSVQPAWRTMFRRFAIAEMTKAILEDIRKDDAPWGKRTISTEVNIIGPLVLETRAKAGVYDGRYGLYSFVEDDETAHGVILSGDLSVDVINNLKAQGFDGLQVQANLALIAATNPDDSKKPGSVAYYVKPWGVHDIVFGDSGETFEDTDVIDGDLFGIGAVLFAALRTFNTLGCICSVSLMPYKTIGGTKNIMQESCTYTSFGVNVKAMYS